MAGDNESTVPHPFDKVSHRLATFRWLDCPRFCPVPRPGTVLTEEWGKYVHTKSLLKVSSQSRIRTPLSKIQRSACTVDGNVGLNALSLLVQETVCALLSDISKTGQGPMQHV
jgi:hypothetical protein